MAPGIASMTFMVISVRIWLVAVANRTRRGPRNGGSVEIGCVITIGFGCTITTGFGCGLTDTRSGGRTGAVSVGAPQFVPSNGR